MLGMVVENEMHVLFHCNLYDLYDHGKDSNCIKTTRNTLTNYNKHVEVCFLILIRISAG